MTTAERSRGYVQSVDRAVDLLEHVWSSADPLTITDLAAVTGLPMATAHRLLSTLERRAWVRRDSTSPRYGVGARFLALAAERAPHLSHLLQPHLDEISAQVGETANAAVLHGVWGVYVAQSEGHHSVRMFTQIGNRVHLHRTGVGKVLLAHSPTALVDRVVDDLGLPIATSKSIPDRRRLDDELAKIRAQSYAVDNEEEEEGVSCVAVPVGSGDEHAGLALSVSGPSGRILPREHHLAEVLQSAAQAVAAKLSPKVAELSKIAVVS